jgi:protocatechuate 3,4-dioxygenase beta subunit
MSSATRLIVWWLCVSLSQLAFAQTQPIPKPTATVQGRVTLDGSPYAGGIMLLQSDEREPDEMLTAPPAPTAVTDSDGRFRFAQVAAGKYHVTMHAQAYVLLTGPSSAITVGEGDAIENQDFKLTRGGVITGKVTDPEGHPRIEEMVSLALVEAANGERRLNSFSSRQTDDRGVYRLFGVPPGKYKVMAQTVGQMEGLFGNQPEFALTYYPNASQEADAKIIEVRAGVEVEGIDIVMARAEAEEKKGFTVSGRLVEGETGKPVSGSMVMLMPNYEASEKRDDKPASRGAAPSMPATTDGLGQFRFSGVASGSYQAMTVNMQGMLTGEGGSTYADPLKFTVAEGDVTGLEIKLKSGATVQGTIAFDTKPSAAPDPAANALLGSMMLIAVPAREVDANGTPAPAVMADDMMGGGMAMAKPDQTFVIKGLKPGKYTVMAQSLTGQKARLVRIERNHAAIQHIQVSGTENISNVKLVFAAANASISGRVQVQGGTLPAGAHFSIIAERAEAKDPSDKSEFTESDVRGQFNFANLTPGVYQLRVMSVRGEGENVFEFEYPEQTVTIADSGKATVVLYVNLKKKENQ